MQIERRKIIIAGIILLVVVCVLLIKISKPKEQIYKEKSVAMPENQVLSNTVENNIEYDNLDMQENYLYEENIELY